MFICVEQSLTISRFDHNAFNFPASKAMHVWIMKYQSGVAFVYISIFCVGYVDNVAYICHKFERMKYHEWDLLDNFQAY